MMLPRRRFLRLAVSAAALPFSSIAAKADNYPNRAVRFIVPFPPGGASDPVARVLGARLSEIWGQPVLVENKGGAGGNIGALAAAQSPPDGYTIFIATNFIATNPFLYSTLGYDPLTDLTAVTRLTVFTNVLLVPNSSPATSLKDFITYAKTNTGKTTYASPGAGTIQHLCGELFSRTAGIALTHVPYRGGGPALTDLMSGRVDMMVATLPSVMSQIQGGTVRALAVTSATRIPFAGNIPTVSESGLPGFDVSDGQLLYMPGKTPAEFVNKVHDNVVAALDHPPVKQKFIDINVLTVSSTPAEATAYLKGQMAKWGAVIKDANIKLE
ncbi:MAG TPA: tripartite tricarboxylate transporter substrate binding protein [Pseudolabrys sp.]|jgi:tripartite-type tricarboxylate transporter receptor subunit TctC